MSDLFASITLRPINERSPATVARADLPALTWSGVRDVVAAIDSMLSKAAA